MSHTILKSNFDKIKNSHSVPDTLILNWDQTGCQLVPDGDWAMATKSGTARWNR